MASARDNGNSGSHTSSMRGVWMRFGVVALTIAITGIPRSWMVAVVVPVGAFQGVARHPPTTVRPKGGAADTGTLQQQQGDGGGARSRNGRRHSSFRTVQRSLQHRHRSVGTRTISSTSLLLSSAAAQSATSTSSIQKPTVVVYQKVVRVSYRSRDMLSQSDFLGLLVDFLQDDFSLPERLPMVYQPRQPSPTTQIDTDNDIAPTSTTTTTTTTTTTASAPFVVQWDSPLSPHSAATALNVHVVAIYTDEPNDATKTTQTTPSSSSSSSSSHMAMVVVEKSIDSKGSRSSIPPMLQNLFADSEKKILKALDRALDEFMVTTTKGQQIGSMPPRSSDTVDSTQTYSQGQQAILAELVSDYGSHTSAPHRRTDDAPVSSSAILDAEYDTAMDIVPPVRQQQVNSTVASAEDTAVESNVTAARLGLVVAESNTTHTPVSQSPPPPTTTGLDFAVQAAKQAQAKRQKQQQAIVKDAPPAAAAAAAAASSSRNDYAVDAARRVAEMSYKVASPTKGQKPQTTTEDTAVSEGDESSSNVIDFSQIRPLLLDAPAQDGRTRAFRTTISKPSDYIESPTTTSSSAPQPEANPDVISVGRNGLASDSNQVNVISVRNGVNLNVRENEREPMIGMSDRSNSLGVADPIIQGARDALNEMANAGEDLSPEELLADVMKFGDQQETTNEVGDGFVSGAFEKAKDILRQQQEKRAARLRADQATFNGQTTVPESITPTASVVKEISLEEELRQMFEAGERIADGRMTTVAASMGAQVAADKEIDALIASDSTVSRYGRVLDDELAELEVRINRSPGEELDGPDKNPMFDIFSGPEVYNVNVDPLTAVNWPGAQLGTKTVTLPKELEEAVKQANFAVEVLRNLREVESTNGSAKYKVGKRELTADQVAKLRAVADEAVAIGLIADPILFEEERARLQMLLDELTQQPAERMREIVSEYKDLLLSDNFVALIKMRLTDMADRDLDGLRNDDDTLDTPHALERTLLGQLVAYAQILLKEVQALGAELESQQLEVIRSICKVAMDPSHQTEEETSQALKDAVRDMRPLFDDAFVAYLKYAVAEEEGRLARAGLLDHPEHNRWLFVLKIVQQGVYTEISKGINRYLEHIWYVLRMETPMERRMLLRKLVDVMPTMDVRPFVQVVENIVGALGDSVRGEFDGVVPLGEMTNKLLQLHRDLIVILPPNRISQKSRDADEWAAGQKERLLQQRNLTKQRLKAAQATEHLENDIEAFGNRGESERFD